MELDYVWESFFWMFAGGLCLGVCWVWVEDMGEEIPVFYSDHWDVIEIKSRREWCGKIERRVAKVKILGPGFGHLGKVFMTLMLLILLPSLSFSLNLLNILHLLHQLQTHKICKIQTHLTKHSCIPNSLRQAIIPICAADPHTAQLPC